jgi:chromosome segregation ATPase
MSMTKTEQAEMQALRERAIDAVAKLAEAEKALASSKSTMDWINKQHNELKAELEQLHIFLDALPGAAPREGERVDYNTPKLSAMTRLAVFMAVRSAAAQPAKGA